MLPPPLLYYWHFLDDRHPKQFSCIAALMECCWDGGPFSRFFRFYRGHLKSCSWSPVLAGLHILVKLLEDSDLSLLVFDSDWGHCTPGKPQSFRCGFRPFCRSTPRLSFITGAYRVILGCSQLDLFPDVWSQFLYTLQPIPAIFHWWTLIKFK